MRNSNGRTPAEMIQDCIEYPATRFTANAEDVLRRCDTFLGIDPDIGTTRRQQKAAERNALFQISKRGPCKDELEYLAGIRGLAIKRDIRQKSRGGWTLTKQGKDRLKAIDTRICEIVTGRKS